MYENYERNKKSWLYPSEGKEVPFTKHKSMHCKIEKYCISGTTKDEARSNVEKRFRELEEEYTCVKNETKKFTNRKDSNNNIIEWIIEEIKEIRKNPDKYKAYTLDELFGEWDL